MKRRGLLPGDDSRYRRCPMPRHRVGRGSCVLPLDDGEPRKGFAPARWGVELDHSYLSMETSAPSGTPSRTIVPSGVLDLDHPAQARPRGARNSKTPEATAGQNHRGRGGVSTAGSTASTSAFGSGVRKSIRLDHIASGLAGSAGFLGLGGRRRPGSGASLTTWLRPLGLPDRDPRDVRPRGLERHAPLLGEGGECQGNFSGGRPEPDVRAPLAIILATSRRQLRRDLRPRGRNSAAWRPSSGAPGRGRRGSCPGTAGRRSGR